MKILSSLLLAPLIALSLRAELAPPPSPTPISTSAHAHADTPSLTPAEALVRLRNGNARWLSGKLLPRSPASGIKATRHAQHPFATVVGCMDSRASAELVFDQGVGDVFSIRVAGNVINDDILGSLEYAHAVAGARLLVVMGHSHCGAIKGAADKVTLDHLTGLVGRIAPAIAAVPPDGRPRSSANPDFVEDVARENVLLGLRTVQERSPVLRSLLESGKIALIGALYDVETGRVEFFDSPLAPASTPPPAAVPLPAADHH